MLSSTGPGSRSREITPRSMLLFACCSGVIRGARPVGRSSCKNQPNRRNSFRIRCSMASSSQSYGYAPSTKTAPKVRSGFRLAQCAATNAP
jgi:hypothetical protein